MCNAGHRIVFDIDTDGPLESAEGPEAHLGRRREGIATTRWSTTPKG